jgi:hypothetical protein
MEDERWLRRVLGACHAERERARTAEFPPPDGYLDDLDRIITNLERKLSEARTDPSR